MNQYYDSGSHEQNRVLGTNVIGAKYLPLFTSDESLSGNVKVQVVYCI